MSIAQPAETNTPSAASSTPQHSKPDGDADPTVGLFASAKLIPQQTYERETIELQERIEILEAEKKQLQQELFKLHRGSEIRI